ncbi:hypothetical protein N7452_005865 [Penicillium brevicompactum]|uniref:Xylanolytic transcriptional activator regulatory domain-containing protein n=1 Tax=Penicillium brevicompactum TaxID=5074 RepID=A0A9W9QJD8_PENBR|nr:hypothetical protein N7452_005865 [Penicillium brevicompactum]
MDSAAIRRRRRRVTDANRKRAARAEHSMPSEDQTLSAPPGELTEIDSSLTADTRIPISAEGSLDPHDLLSPASALSQGLAEHVVSGQSKKVPWPNILCRLREAFSLDLSPSTGERDIAALQAHTTRSKPLQPSEMARLQAAIGAFPPRQIADFLVSVFVKHATDLFFYLDQDQMLTELDQFYRDQTCPLRSDLSFVCLALATFALGSQWTTLERPEESVVSLNRDDDDLGRVFYTHAKTLIPDIIDRSCLRSIQAPFLLGVYLMPANAIGSSYVYMGLALRKAIAFDLHLENVDESINATEVEIRRRLWWSIYSLERCTTIKLNRPRSISTDIIKTPDPSPLLSLDSRQNYNNIQYQMAYTRLIRILDQIAEPRKSSTGYVENHSEKWRSDLRQWKKSLPAEFKIDTMDPKDSRYRPTFHLYLNYYYAWITMGKVALVTVARTNLRNRTHPSSESSKPSEYSLSESQSCVKGARKLLLLFETLTKHRKITRFSFTDFQGCSIATIVTLVSGIMERDSGYEGRVAFGLDCLRRMATGNMTAKMGVKFVEAVQTITNEARNKLHDINIASREPEPQNESPASLSDYDRWAEWFSKLDRPQTQEQRSSLEEAIVSEQPVQFSQMPSESAASNMDAMASWRTANDQFEIEESLLPLAMPMNRVFQYSTDELCSALQSDDPTFLMGLTGLDVLDFSGFP